MNLLPCNHNLPSAHSNYYESVGDIPDQVYEDLRCKKNLYFNPKYLIALEKNNSQIQFAYIVLNDDNGNAIGLCVIQVIDFNIDGFQDESQTIFEYIKCLGRKFRILPSGKPLKVFTCGNTFVTGEHGVVVRPDQDRKKILKQFVRTALELVNSREDLKKEIDAYMIKDFIEESLSITDELKTEGFYSFQVEPNMIMKIDSDWEEFNDYLAAMKTKFRVKAKKAFLKSAKLKVKDIELATLDELLPEMTRLYKKVSTRAGFNLGAFNLSTYKTLKENLGDSYILKGYWLDGKLVGFLSGIISRNNLDAHFVGIEYDLNRELAIYQRMLYDYIETAIVNKVKWLSFGRTASEIKSSVGAVPQEMTIYLRHRKHLPNKILSLFLNKIKPTEFNQKFPFKMK
ncbi:Acetyltransferase (GNAT) domain-containing protein [Tenacibaculum sp. MAR_2009_124]|uniref:GNAT family N-acetyltransferase n=1 Tax=Tenacibaculum sp. MAR_2009_124 TaxID=1250059 RepID=UPI00089567B2|nr:GNAT family N-acetyltransferase [Tenacibaculum sp. MAR_2009_124]SEC30768.1 Acetyltransferase (GNAT) domain-containing protein [Tenacibaculum sp. MAR_2009_124]